MIILKIAIKIIMHLDDDYDDNLGLNILLFLEMISSQRIWINIGIYVIVLYFLLKMSKLKLQGWISVVENVLSQPKGFIQVYTQRHFSTCFFLSFSFSIYQE